MTNAILGTDRNSLTASSVATTVSGRQRSRSSTTTTRSMSDSCFISSAKSSWKPCRVGSAAVSSSPPKSSMTSSIFGRPIERPRPPADGDQRHRRTAPLVSNDAPRRHRGDVKASQNRQRWREFRHVWGHFGLRVMKFGTPDAASKCENLSVCWRSRSGANRTRTGDLVGAIQGAQRLNAAILQGDSGVASRPACRKLLATCGSSREFWHVAASAWQNLRRPSRDG
jgi:hypothetical protein